MVIKSPKLKYADSGFLKQSQNALHVELYSVGTPILSLQVNSNTCINKICYKNEQFNLQFLGYMYEKNMLKNILLKEPIYGGKNYQKTEHGFTQIIKDKNKNIYYNIEQNSTTFRDKSNKILIKIKSLNNQ